MFMIEVGQTYPTKKLVPCTVVAFAKHSETEEFQTIYTSGQGLYWSLQTKPFEETGPVVPETFESPVFVVPLGPHQHFKGNLYSVVCRVRDALTLENLLVYGKEDEHYWVRPERMFTEEVCWPDGIQRPRFRRLTVQPGAGA